VLKKIDKQIKHRSTSTLNVIIDIMHRLDATDVESVRKYREKVFGMDGSCSQERSMLYNLRQWLTFLLSTKLGYTPSYHTHPSENDTNEEIPEPTAPIEAQENNAEPEQQPKIVTADFSMQTDYIPQPFDKEAFEKIFQAHGMDINQETTVAIAKPEMSLFEQLCERMSTKKNKVVSVGMWHSTWGGMPNTHRYVPSHRYPDEKWHITKTATGFNCAKIPVRSVHPDMGGVSNTTDQAYGADEERPIKHLQLDNFMDIKLLTLVDMELYPELKSFVLESGVVASTQATLQKKAVAYFKRFRIDHLDPIMLLDVRSWTVYAAMIATETELKGVDLMAKGSIMRNMGRVSEFKRTGTVTTSWLNGFSLRRPILFGMRKKMYKPEE